MQAKPFRNKDKKPKSFNPFLRRFYIFAFSKECTKSSEPAYYPFLKEAANINFTKYIGIQKECQ